MGIIRVQTPNDGIVRVQIQGDEPTEQEMQKIRELDHKGALIQKKLK